jgi:uncharacterized protein (DUF1499 family)
MFHLFIVYARSAPPVSPLIGAGQLIQRYTNYSSRSAEMDVRMQGESSVMILKFIGAGAVVLLMVWAAWFAWLSHTATTPQVQLLDGHLRPCPETPNCVSSESVAPQSRIEPLRFKGAPQAVWADLESSIRDLGGSVVEQRDGFLWATFTSRLFRFVDDMEFRMVAAEGVIHLRSASRVGRSDMGGNRERVARLRQLFEQRQGRHDM